MKKYNSYNRRAVKLSIAFILAVLLLISCGEKAVDPPVDDGYKYIPGYFDSQIINRTFKTYLYAPEDYLQFNPDRYHVIYLLDADWYFDGSHYRLPNGGLIQIVKDLQQEFNFPEVLIVGIGYPDENWRQRDFLFPKDPISDISGGGEYFYQFLKTELIPVVDSRFKTQGANGRTLIGHSYGGYFTMFSLLHYRPDEEMLFNNYLAISPSNYYHDFYLKLMDDTVAYECDNILPLNLYMSVGSNEWDPMQNGFDTMVTRFNYRNYDSFNFKSARYSGLNHGTVVRPSLTNGLKWLFEQ